MEPFTTQNLTLKIIISMSLILIIALTIALIQVHSQWKNTTVKQDIDKVLYIGYLSDDLLESISSDLVPGSAFVVGIDYKEETLGVLGFGKEPVTEHVPNLSHRLASGESIETNFPIAGELGNVTIPVRFIPRKSKHQAEAEVWTTTEKTQSEHISLQLMELKDLNTVYANILALPEA
jgi:hypothetical protein